MHSEWAAIQHMPLTGRNKNLNHVTDRMHWNQVRWWSIPQDRVCKALYHPWNRSLAGRPHMPVLHQECQPPEDKLHGTAQHSTGHHSSLVVRGPRKYDSCAVSLLTQGKWHLLLESLLHLLIQQRLC